MVTRTVALTASPPPPSTETCAARATQPVIAARPHGLRGGRVVGLVHRGGTGRGAGSRTGLLDGEGGEAELDHGQPDDQQDRQEAEEFDGHRAPVAAGAAEPGGKAYGTHPASSFAAPAEPVTVQG